jgi:hypothetical protein
LPVSIVGKAAHLSRPLYQPTLGQSELKASHGSPSPVRILFSEIDNRLVKVPLSVYLFFSRILPIHHQGDFGDLETEQRLSAVEQLIGVMLTFHQRRLPKSGIFALPLAEIVDVQ